MTVHPPPVLLLLPKGATARCGTISPASKTRFFFFFFFQRVIFFFFPFKVICNYCSPQTSYSSTSATATLFKHLRSHHPSYLPQTKQFTLDEAFNAPLKGQRKEELDEALITWIIEDFQAFYVVDSPAFQEFVSKLNPRYSAPPGKPSLRGFVLFLCLCLFIADIFLLFE